MPTHRVKGVTKPVKGFFNKFTAEIIYVALKCVRQELINIIIRVLHANPSHARNALALQQLWGKLIIIACQPMLHLLAYTGQIHVISIQAKACMNE